MVQRYFPSPPLDQIFDFFALRMLYSRATFYLTERPAAMNELEYVELAAWRLVSQLKAVARTATEKAIIDAFEQFAREIARCREIQTKMADGKLKREVQQKPAG